MFVHHRTIRFADTDAAGVVYFANYLSICHEAYEESLAAAGIALPAFFGAERVLIPIARSSAEYLRPLACGDRITVTVAPARLGPDSFAIAYEVRRAGPPEKLAARVRTEHVCISGQSRERQPLPPALADWIQRTA